MEFANSLDSRSSPGLIQFIPFINSENECYNCKGSYSTTRLFYQKYCEYCLMSYIEYTDNDNLDVSIGTIYSQCKEHEPRSLDFCTRNIKEWCNSCSIILCFKQIVTNNSTRLYSKKYFKKIQNCGFCGKSIYQQEHLDELDYGYVEFKLCSDCYQMSVEWNLNLIVKSYAQIARLFILDADIV
ncbi:hypothetical protein RhiirB3_452198 [Rhizophagus irregularis]|nr:hypothetical protein RhiirB3_452198 [Rhizophagus irregularis]